MVQEQVEYLQKQYGKIEAQTAIVEGLELSLKVSNEEAGIDAPPTVEWEQLKGKKNLDTLRYAGLNKSITLKTKGFI